MNTWENLMAKGIENAKNNYMRKIEDDGKKTGMYDVIEKVLRYANHYTVAPIDKVNNKECISFESAGKTAGSKIIVTFYTKKIGHFMHKKRVLTGYALTLNEFDSSNEYYYVKDYKHVFGDDGKLDHYTISEWNEDGCETKRNDPKYDNYYRCLRTLQTKNSVNYIFDGIKQVSKDVVDESGELIDVEVEDINVSKDILRVQKANLTNENVCNTFENDIKTDAVEAVNKKHLAPSGRYIRMSLFQDFKNYVSQYVDYMIEEKDSSHNLQDDMYR